MPDAAPATPTPKNRLGSIATRLLPLGLLAIGLAVFFGFGLQRYLTFHSLARNRAWLGEAVAQHGVLALAIYMLIYTTVVALSVPGGVILTLTGGFLFGTVTGTIATVISATLGATLLFVTARAGIGDHLRRRAGPMLGRFEAGFRRNAFSYLLMLRLLPLVPFFLINLLPAFLGVPLRTYVLATLLGIIPAVLVFASIGNGLGAVFDAGQMPDLSIFSKPSIAGPLLGLALLALLPVIYQHWRRRSNGALDEDQS
ncbi:MAG TPA: VTT domain-containing protein [Stellaceae bacterium]|nr:VTT domain-containing protein [Stellaceae bacterium]